MYLSVSKSQRYITKYI